MGVKSVKSLRNARGVWWVDTVVAEEAVSNLPTISCKYKKRYKLKIHVSKWQVGTLVEAL